MIAIRRRLQHLLLMFASLSVVSPSLAAKDEASALRRWKASPAVGWSGELSLQGNLRSRAVDGSHHTENSQERVSFGGQAYPNPERPPPDHDTVESSAIYDGQASISRSGADAKCSGSFPVIVVVSVGNDPLSVTIHARAKDPNSGCSPLVGTHFHLESGKWTYSGSMVDESRKGNIDEVDYKIVHSWNVSREAGKSPSDAPVDVRVVGPRCLCGDDVGKFTAQTNMKGGAFEAFELQTTEGEKPEVPANRGGATPEMQLRGGSGTGKTEIVAVYKSGGKVHRSAPHHVSFCYIEKPHRVATEYLISNDDWMFLNSDMDSKIRIQYKAKGWMNGRDLSEELKWKIADGNDPLLKPEKERGGAQTFVGSALPRENKHFGPREVEANLTGGDCDCNSERVRIRVFFPRQAKNGPDPSMPNWAFYWRQTRAGRTESGREIPFKYASPLPPQKQCQNNVFKFDQERPQNAACVYDYCADQIYCGDAVITRFCAPRPDGTVADKIDCFAQSLWHENRHRAELTTWWGPGIVNYKFLDDPDTDLVPTSVELTSEGCNPHSGKSCAGRPDPSLEDTELSAYRSGWSWPVGGADSEDWACPGKQCPRK